MAANPSVSCASRWMLVAATLTAMILDHGAVDVRATADQPWREDAGQGARSRDRVGHPRVEQAGKAPHDLHAGMEIGGVDEQAALEIAEGDVADEARDQRLERLAAVQCGRQQAPQRDVDAGHLEYVPPLHQERPRFHPGGRGPRGPGRPDQRPDARPDHQAGRQSALFERPEHADVGESLEAAAAEYEGEGSVRDHSLARVEVASVTFAEKNLQESCAARRVVRRCKGVRGPHPPG